MQNTSTNALERYHRDIKVDASTQDSFLKTVKVLDQVLTRKLNDSDRLRFNAKSQKLLYKEYPFLASFPPIFQNLLMKEINRAIERCTEAEKLHIDLLGSEHLDCKCLFAQKYLLPCQHYFHLQFMGFDVLDDQAWQKLHETFKEAGLDIYYTVSRVEVFTQEERLDNKTLSVMGDLECLRNIW
jgi:hypothetical protein